MSAAGNSSRPISLVTGGAGFIGSHMVDLLIQKGHHVRVIDNLTSGRLENLKQWAQHPQLEFKKMECEDISFDDSFFVGVENVFHFAGRGDIVPSIEKPYDYMNTNVMGTVTVLEASRHAGVKSFVYAASSSCYGLADPGPTPETAEIRTEYPYALSKFLGERAALHWAKVYKLKINSIRMFNVYGTRSRTSGAYGAVFGVFLKQKIAGRPLTVVGDGTQTRDFVYVTDVAEAFWKVSQAPVSGEVFNLGAGKPQSVNRLTELLGGEKIYIPKRPGEPDCTWAQISKIQKMTGWQPRISFEEGVQTMLASIDYWKDAPLWDVQSIESATKTWFKYLKSGATP